MEQGGAELSPAPSDAEKSESISVLTRIKNAVVIGLVAATALAAGIKSEGDMTTPEKPSPFPGQISGLDQSHATVESFTSEEEAIQKSKDKGEGVVILPPNRPDTQEAYLDFYTGYGESSSLTVPRLREAAYIINQDLFKPEEKHSNVYPFGIYNATDYPLDLRFINYALNTSRLWLDQALKQESGKVNIGGHTNAVVRPNAVPHAFIYTNSYPGSLNRDHYSRGTTSRYPDYLSISYLVREKPFYTDGIFNTDLPFSKRGIATEICQSLIWVEKVKPVFGEEAILEAERQYWEKPESQLGSDQIGQEQICNALGSITTAIYEGGYPELQQLMAVRQTKVGLRQTPRLDLSIADQQIPAFFHLKRQAQLQDNHINTVGHTDLPTVNWYKHHER